MAERRSDAGDHGEEHTHRGIDSGVGRDETVGGGQVGWVDKFIPTGKDVDGVPMAFAAFGDGS